MTTLSTRGTNLPRMGGFNQAALLEAIRLGAGTCTRADLARKTGLSAQTVTNAVRRLLDAGLVTEEDVKRQPGAGRPGTTLDIVPASRFAVGVHLDPASVVVVLLDLAGQVVASRTAPTPESEEPGAALDVVVREIDAVLEGAGVERERVLGVGLATPGPIDRERGLVLDPPHLTTWHDVPLRDEVARRTGLPTLLDKDVLAVAAAVVWFPGVRPTDAAVVYAGTGVAIAIVSGGEIVRGVSGNAGEAGHVNVGRPFGRCACGRQGCLGGVFSANAIHANAVERGIPLGGGAADAGSTATLRADRAVDDLRVLAESGDAVVVAFLRETGAALGSALTTVCELLDLDTVVPSGPVWERLGPWLEPGLRSVLDAYPVPGHHPLRVLSAAGDGPVAAVGAACLLLDDVLTPRPTGLLLHA
ncbi:ROK family transcriptional regulator [Luteimicrobium sp. NPDC057192]|uniref:ROK family transcriptional regulator n=1 Tax=Luteimicrobium sp. NPDC057192 TaxID=3346042 RepID=UPI0036319F7B